MGSNLDIICTALTHWANYIQTGDITLTPGDAENLKMKIKPLTLEQMKFIVRLEEIKEKVRASKQASPDLSHMLDMFK